MKKRNSLIAIILLLVMLVSGCAQVNPAVPNQGNQSPNTGGSGGSGGAVLPDNGNDKEPGEGDNVFTVSLSYEGKKYIPEEGITVQWTDGYSVFTAPFNSEGVAEVSGLDGDYTVTLSKTPEGYIYNPNNIIATNDKSNVVIDLYKITPTRGEGKELYDCISLTRPAIFSATINGPDHVIFYQFTPAEAGAYSVEGWVDITENKINPKLDVYWGSSQYKQYSHTLNDGGAESFYTKNFYHEVKVAKDGIGQAFTFALKATSKDNTYPIQVNFVVQLNGSFDSGLTDKVIALPEDKLVQAPNYSSTKYQLVTAETTEKGYPLLDQSKYELWKVSEGGDGYYHVFDLVKYADTNGYGPILFAFIDTPTKFYGTAFTDVEDGGNNALTIAGVNWKMAIEGFSALTVDDPHPERGSYLCVLDCPCYMEAAEGYIGTCPAGCEKCSPDCRHLTDEAWEMINNVTEENGTYICRYDCKDCVKSGTSIGCQGCNCSCDQILIPDQFLGYSGFSNADGMYPVTESIKYFLQTFCIQQGLFMDGNGLCETNPTNPVDSDEESQWLFACAYYRERQ